ncbi:uncharacterized protein LOC128959455 [Oppia nitens]|uniref:uncharacterized protein LOC128959455 n=1 Tax=Oppia nitens TaxID=1686743 RepID=UPI0023DA89FB|nr:uncharacterized protein LOC128959455 [Oppia nitens]
MATFTRFKDEWTVCPFNVNHKIATRNIIKHTIECEKKVNLNNYSVCIYNVSHRMDRHDFAAHIKSCPDGRQHMRDQEIYDNQWKGYTATGVIFDDKPNQLNNQQFGSISAHNSQEITEDEWSNDNNTDYDINDNNTTKQSDDNKVMNLKLTKNQKKRNKRKAAKAKSIWD